MAAARAACLSLLVGITHADVYMHNPRGSNDRNCERNVNRNNGNRLFDSQNNAKGGYACPRAVGDESMQNEAGLSSRLDGSNVIVQSKKMYYYEGSVLPVEWTNQHGCGQNSKTNCEIILQYMCEDFGDPHVDGMWPYTSTKHAGTSGQAFRVNNEIASPRDGIPIDADDAATDTIPDTEEAATPDSPSDRRYGMHESFGYYELCQRTERNKGLYTADQNVRRNDMRGTRQNPNGNRRGLECPEERDYYPHWMPSPWIDIAVLTNDASDTPCTELPCDSNRCQYYLENSQNTNKKHWCDVAVGDDVTLKTSTTAWSQRKWHNNREACEEAGFVWRNMSASDLYEDIAPPVCAKTQFARVNQLGNAVDSAVISTSEGAESGASPQGINANRFLWTIPYIPTPKVENYFDYGNGVEDAYATCTLRLRYNISTSDFPQWPTEALPTLHQWTNEMVDHHNNSKNLNDESPNVPLFQDPYVYVGAGDDADDEDHFVSLAVNTNQYGRTFQDRSYSFKVKKRPTAAAAEDLTSDTPAVPAEALAADAKIYNVNVRGKRGNIVQTYPAVEYDFVPNALALEPGDLVHFQWTGSDYNPRRGCNDAEGGPPDPNDFTSTANAGKNSRADRSNVVFMNSMAENVPRDSAGYSVAAGEDMTYAQRLASTEASYLDHAPCAAEGDGADTEDGEECSNFMRRLAYLNQQSDGLALSLRGQRDCLTEDELDAISSKNERENHPLNCAKLNAKPFPYFDAGLMVARRSGFFAYFSSRNNNFSNRDQTGVVCVKNADGSGCDVDASSGVLQDANPAITVAPVTSKALEAARARCFDEANSDGAANAQGAQSCQSLDGLVVILEDGTFAVENKDNDALGDGNEDPCDIIYWTVWGSTSSKTKRYVMLALILFAVGAFLAWFCYFGYNRVVAYRAKTRKFQGGTDWKHKKVTEMY